MYSLRSSRPRYVSWRQGAFQIAAEKQIPVVAFNIRYTPIRQTAYIEQDVFLPHLMNLSREKDIEAFINFQGPYFIEKNMSIVEDMRAWCQSKSNLFANA